MEEQGLANYYGDGGNNTNKHYYEKNSIKPKQKKKCKMCKPGKGKCKMCKVRELDDE